MAYLVFARIRMLVEKLPRHQDEARRAEAALEGGPLDECFLHGVELSRALYGLYMCALGERREVQTARHRRAVDEHRAATAEALPAALARPVQTERVAPHFDQRLVRRDLRLDRLAVQSKLDRASHRLSAM